MSEASFIGM